MAEAVGSLAVEAAEAGSPDVDTISSCVIIEA